VKKTDADLLKVRSFGKTSLREVKRKLADMGLSLGMDVDNLAAAQAAAAAAAHAGDEDGDEAEEADTEAASS
jgi:DNA-directed RNA polymerase subunit alpha